MRPGVALKPGTPIEEVFPPKFMPDMMNKVRTLREKYPTLDVEVNGGLRPSTIDAATSGIWSSRTSSSYISTENKCKQGPKNLLKHIHKKCLMREQHIYYICNSI
ncbi:putative ribulose-phosphate 3-epimerase [Helianthus annuus]|uniref:Ribulose-phosphate 3-epimerase n=1 Tax=Helianthus annuus TaxID=4232 RepID=A0A251VMV2_HELAN|nr:putative ribulose-phosphate 3-epimerase [Helianthus annuus]KAJ0621708.1 putative ribulose-phosphate 3-epimerase [Helianthus annuus]KAJ0626126.1 putative ribulose-phosphate 3-epimerase [Helianthus annuus]KAJ0782459.1 putative ribulose-phosphate 3-epimerase [Helianthus annuus]KAJ0807977.1 putative ribulose-phosphate 3-epimerase [Helianthus annuus]